MASEDVWIAIAIAVIAAGISGLALWYSRRQVNSDAMLECFRLLGSPEVKACKAIIAKEWCGKRDKGETPIFNRTPAIKGYAATLISAHNQACALYELGLLHKDNFKKVYGVTLVRAWKLLEADIKKRREKAGEDYGIHFDRVAHEFMPAYPKIEPYCEDDPEKQSNA